MNPELFLEQKDIIPLTQALREFANKVSFTSDRQDLLVAAGIDDNFLSNLKFDAKPITFAQALVAEFRKYRISNKQWDYHPMINLLTYLSTLAPYELADEYVILFTRLIKQGQENFKALVARNTVGLIESPKGTGIGTGVLVKQDLLLTCYHVFSKSGVHTAWVRFNYKPGSYLLDNYLFELELDYVSYSPSSLLDYALVRVKGEPQQKTATPIDILNSGEQIRLIHHPQGKPVEISGVGEITQLGEDYIYHNLPTYECSSGAPIFNSQWELIGLHQGHHGIDRQVLKGQIGGIPTRAFWKEILQYLD